MGVDITTYLVRGVKIDPKLVDFNKHERYIEGWPDLPFQLIYDGMCGEYAIAGQVLGSCDEYEGFKLMEVNTSTSPLDNRCLEEINKEFNTDFDELKTYLFTHYH